MGKKKRKGQICFCSVSFSSLLMMNINFTYKWKSKEIEIVFYTLLCGKVNRQKLHHVFPGFLSHRNCVVLHFYAKQQGSCWW